MALTFARWVALALVGMAMMAAIILRERPRVPYVASEREVLTSRRNRALMQAQIAADELRQRQLMDSVSRLGALRDATAGGILIDASLPPGLRTAVDSALANVAMRRPTNPLTRSQVVVVADRNRGVASSIGVIGYPGAIAFNYVLPDPGSAEPCVVIARVRTIDVVEQMPRRRMAELSSTTTSDRLLGPCAFYEAFGQPGTHVDTWLRSRGWSFGQRSNFGTSMGAWIAPEWDRRDFKLHDLVSDQGMGCAVGDDAMCLRALTEPETDWQRRIARGAWVTTARFNPFTQSYAYHRGAEFDFGPREWTLLADMARDVGPDRFTAFWQSQLPLPEAFAGATGTSLAQWTREWIIGTYGQPTRGPLVTRTSIAFAMLLVLSAVGASSVVARRRVLV
jgi:hypothetical protein